MPKVVYEELGSEQFSLAPVGSGPFSFVSWVKDVELRLDAFDDYWKGRPQVDGLSLRPLAEATSRVSALRAGEVHIATDLPPDQVAVVEGAEGIHIENGSGLTQLSLAMNSAFAPFDDVRVRQAVNYAIDLDLIIETIMGGRGEALGQPFAPNSFGFDPSIAPYPYDPDKAKSLLREAGYPEGFTTQLWSRSGGGVSGADDQVNQAITAMLAEVGITVEINAMEESRYSEVSLDATTPGFVQFSNRDALGDGDFILGLWFDSSRRSPFYNTPELDSMIRAQVEETDRDTREKLLRDIAAHMHDEAPVGFLFTIDTIYGVSDRVSGWTSRGDRVVEISVDTTLAD